MQRTLRLFHEMLTHSPTGCPKFQKDHARARSDIHINVDKTKSMHVERQARIAPPSFEKVMATEVNYKNVCEFCGRHFKTARGMKIHKASCNHFHNLTDDEDEIKLINATFDTPQHRWCRVEWEGHPGKDTWEPERSLLQQNCGASIEDFWHHSDLDHNADFIADPDDVWRCWTCGAGYASHSTLAAHITRQHIHRARVERRHSRQRHQDTATQGSPKSQTTHQV